MRFGTVAGRAVLVTGPVTGGGATGADIVDIAAASGGRFGPDPLTALAQWDEVTEWAASLPGSRTPDPRTPDPRTPDPRTSDPPGRVQLGPPVPHPRQVFAVALNYRPHANEAGFTPPEVPLIFTKFPSCLTGPLASVPLTGDRVDWEVELVAVVGRGGHRIPTEQAGNHLAGYTVGQDLSDRAVQLAGHPPQFSLGKSAPGFGPIGPVLVTPDQWPSAPDAAISCALNGELVQQARTDELIFSVAELVAYLSASCRLLPGDLIFTGTPGGVGNRMTPPRFLRPGDQLVSRIEGIGELVTDFVPALKEE